MSRNLAVKDSPGGSHPWYLLHPWHLSHPQHSWTPVPFAPLHLSYPCTLVPLHPCTLSPLVLLHPFTCAPWYPCTFTPLCPHTPAPSHPWRPHIPGAIVPLDPSHSYTLATLTSFETIHSCFLSEGEITNDDFFTLHEYFLAKHWPTDPCAAPLDKMFQKCSRQMVGLPLNPPLNRLLEFSGHYDRVNTKNAYFLCLFPLKREKYCAWKQILGPTMGQIQQTGIQQWRA